MLKDQDMTGWEYWTSQGVDVPTSVYSEFVEGMIITSGKDRMIENTLGIVGEAGEVAEKIKKGIRDDVIDETAIIKELGDVLFYVTALANYFGHSLDSVMEMNMKKLLERKRKGTIQGSGDNR